MGAEPCGAAQAQRMRGLLLQRVLPWLLAVALHLALIAVWNSPGRPAPRPGDVPSARVIQLELVAEVSTAPARLPGRAAPGPAARPLQRAAAAAAATPPAGRVAVADDRPAVASEALPPGEPAAPGGPDVPAAPALLDTPATRQAIRAAAGARSLRALGDAAVEARRPLTSEERLGQDIARAARGDCLKGEHFGGGAGLLSLPFWLAAEASGKCRR